MTHDEGCGVGGMILRMLMLVLPFEPPASARFRNMKNPNRATINTLVHLSRRFLTMRGSGELSK